MNDSVRWHRDTLGEKVVKALTKNNFTATYVQSRQEAAAKLLELIPPDATIGFGGSVTLNELAIIPQLEERGNPVGTTPSPASARRR